MRYKTAAVALAVLASILPAAAAERLFTLDPAATEATFTLDATLHLVHGTLSVQAGEIRFDTETGAASGRIVLDATRSDTGNSGRDKKMHDRVLESALYPTIVFRPTSVEGSLGGAGRGTLDLHGRVTIHGEEHPLTLHTEVEISGGRAVGTASFSVPYVEWGMRDPSVFILRVAKEVNVSILAEGTLAER